MLFKGVINYPKSLVSYFDSFQNVLDDTNIKINTYGMSITGMDPTHVCYIDSLIDKLYFDEFILKQKEITIGINISNLYKILKASVKSNDILTFIVKDIDKLIIQVSNETRDVEYNLNTINLDIEDLQIPSVDYDSNIELHPQLFSTFISQMDVMDNDTFTFNLDNKIPTILGNNGVKINIKQKNDYKKFKIMNSNEEIIKSLSPVHCKYNIYSDFTIDLLFSFIKKISKSASFASYLKIELSPDYPVYFNYTLEDKLTIYYHISPKIVE